MTSFDLIMGGVCIAVFALYFLLKPAPRYDKFGDKMSPEDIDFEEYLIEKENRKNVT